MPAWMMYRWEKSTWPEFQFTISREDAAMYIRKLSRHFKTNCGLDGIDIKRHEGAGHYSVRHGLIVVGKQTTLGIVCHEFAHHLDYMKRGRPKRWHDRKYKRQLKKVYTWAKRWLPAKEAN